jgi:hypothetical protein
MDWTALAQDTDQWQALVNMTMNLNVPQNVAKFLSICATGGYSRRARVQGVSTNANTAERFALRNRIYDVQNIN